MPSPAATRLTPAQRAFLETPRIAVIATVGEDGAPHQAAVWFRLEPDGTILLNSRVARRWPQDLRRTGRVSIAVVGPDDGSKWLGLAGELASVDDDPVRGLDGIVALHRHYHDGVEGPEVRPYYAPYPRVSLFVRIVGVHDHLDRA